MKMPYRRRSYYRRRRPYTSRPYGKKTFRRVIKPYLRKKQAKGLAVFKLKGVDGLNATAGGVINTYYSTTNPQAFLNGAGTLADWSNLGGLYDSYRVCAIKLKYFPDAPNDTTVPFKPVYIHIDYDNPVPVSTLSAVTQYERVKVKTLYRPWSVYYKIPKTGGGTGTTTGYGWYDIATPPTLGSIGIYSQGLTGSIQYGQIVATYYIACKNRR